MPTNILGLTHHIDSFVSKLDQKVLKYRSWLPEGDIKTIFFIHHGFGDHSGRYPHLINALHDNHTAFFAIDARGHGYSEGKRGHVNDFSEFAKDLNQFIDLVHQRYPQQIKILFGHSMGGAVVLDFCLNEKNQSKINALITSAPALYIKTDLLKSIKKFIGTQLAKIAPATVVNAGLNTDYLSHDEKARKDRNNDDLVHGKISFALGVSFFGIGPIILKQAKKIKLPIFVFHGTCDEIIDPKSSEELYALVGSHEKTLKLYDGLYHEIFNELPELRAKPMQDIKNWVNEYKNK